MHQSDVPEVKTVKKDPKALIYIFVITTVLSSMTIGADLSLIVINARIVGLPLIITVSLASSVVSLTFSLVELIYLIRRSN